MRAGIFCVSLANTQVFYIHYAQSLPGFDGVTVDPSCMHIAHIGNLFKSRLVPGRTELRFVYVCVLGGWGWGDSGPQLHAHT